MHEDVYQVSWEAGFRSWRQNLLPWRSSEGKQRRNFVGELDGATCTTSCLLTHHSLCHVNVRAAWNGYLGFFSPGYLEWQRPFRAKLMVKKSLWNEILLIWLWEFVGVQREFKGRLENDCNTLMNPPLSLSLSLSSVSLLFFSWTKSYFSLPVFFYFFSNPPAAIWKIEEPHEHLPCFLHETGCQCNYLRLLSRTLCMFFFVNLSASFNKTAFPSL